MPRRKRQHLAELLHMPNFFDHPQHMKGNWHQEIFGNTQPIVLELGCGKGHYAIALAEKYPQINVIGIDKKGDRLWHGVRQAQVKNLSNVRFVRLPIERITDYFAPSEVSEIWITFPDPYPRRGEAKKRLVSPVMMALYQQIINPIGVMHLKTDNEGLFEYACEVLDTNHCPIKRKIAHIYQDAIHDEMLTIKTTFENKYLALGKRIQYISWSFE